MPKIAINVPQPFHKTVPFLRNKVLISPGVRTLISIKLYRRPKKLQNQFLWFVALKADCRAEDADDTEDAATEQWGDSRALSCQLGYGWWCCWPCQNDTQGAERRGGPLPPPQPPFPLWGFCSSASICFHLHSRASALWPPSLPPGVAQSQLGSRRLQHFNVVK